MTEEEPRSPKLQNMAASERQGSATEPSLSEIRKMLINIQSTTSSTLSKNSHLAAELAELKNAFESQKRELSDIKKLDEKTMSLNKTSSEELKQTRKKIND